MTTTIEIPTLHTERLVLRAFRAGDWDRFAMMESNPDVRRYRGANLLSREEAWDAMQRMLGQWALRGYGVFAVAERQSGRFIGFTGVLHPVDWPEPELAYSLDAPFWGQGYAVEAATEARDWAFAHHDMERLASFILPDNSRSIRVAQTLGGIREGTVALRGFVAEWWVHMRPGASVVV